MAPWRSRAKHLISTLLNFVFPPVCVNCGKVGALLCADCIVLIPWLHEPLCPYCGRTVNRPVTRCPSCRSHPLPLRKIRAAVLFADPIPTIIHKLKYKNSFALAEPLAGLMAEAWSDWQTTVDLVVPIPLHPQKKKERGYNQSALLAYYLCQRLGLLYDSEALWRKRYTEPQVRLSMADRMINVEGAFGASRERVAGKKILLIDDVCTTGATLSAATVALLAEGAETVSAYCLARAI